MSRVAVIGAGFGGLAAARKPADAPIHLTVVDRRNHHLETYRHRLVSDFRAINPREARAMQQSVSAAKNILQSTTSATSAARG